MLSEFGSINYFYLKFSNNDGQTACPIDRVTTVVQMYMDEKNSFRRRAYTNVIIKISRPLFMNKLDFNKTNRKLVPK